jgi:Protein of unknown function (DUF3300)
MNALSELNNLTHSPMQTKPFGWVKKLLPYVLLIMGFSPVALAQSAPLPPPELDHLVSQIALYPDPLLAQTLTASTFWNEIPDAAAWADRHSNLTGDALAHAIQDDHLQWDPSVLGLLPFPSVLDMMARDTGWTQRLGNAVLIQRSDVMDAVQRMRRQARDYGYLVPNGYVNVVDAGGYVEILPLNPGVFYVPFYDPVVVFARPRPGFVVGTAIHFGPAVTISATFGTWGWWTGPAFYWPAHTIVIGGHPWERGWVNRGVYVHPYPHAWLRPVVPRVEIHHGR